MSDYDEDDKPTVVLDLNALKKQQLKKEEELANIATELVFAVDEETSSIPKKFPVILFDFQSDLFQKNLDQFPPGHDYQICRSLEDLNDLLKRKMFQVVVFNFDANPKAVNTLSAQMKKKFPHTKVLIMARAISPEKARLHAQTPAGASSYYQFPIEASRVEEEFRKIHTNYKQTG